MPNPHQVGTLMYIRVCTHTRALMLACTLTDCHPPAAVAAQMVSSILRHNSERQPQSPQIPRHRSDSTDTEDSDDSEQEEDRTPPKMKVVSVRVCECVCYWTWFIAILSRLQFRDAASQSQPTT